jgi:hypothetical protein
MQVNIRQEFPTAESSQAGAIMEPVHRAKACGSSATYEWVVGGVSRACVDVRAMRLARPERFELPTLWFEVFGSKISNCFFGVAYEPRTPFEPSSVVRRLSAIQRSENCEELAFGWSACAGIFGQLRQRVASRPIRRTKGAARLWAVMNPSSFEQTLVEVWRQTLVENAMVVVLGTERFPVRLTPKHGLRQVDFIFDENEIRGLEQNPETKSRWVYFLGYPTDCAKMIFCCGCKFKVLASAGLSILPRTTVTSPSEAQ